jgi:hypothetical protein
MKFINANKLHRKSGVSRIRGPIYNHLSTRK